MRALIRAAVTFAVSALAIASTPALPAGAATDFGGDGKSDILWRNAATGQNYLYPMSGTTVLPTEGYLRTVPPEWKVAGIADFNGDGKADVLWRNSVTGENYMYLMQGTTVVAEGYLRRTSLEWKVAGVADFNGDARADILWRNTVTGENYIYLLDATTIAGEGYIRTVPVGWNVVGVADFNGDAKADILWRNSLTGDNYIYPMNGLTILSSEGYIRTVADTSWQVKGIGDFNGDGMADILWRNASSGQTYLYPMNGLAVLGAEGYLRTVSEPWQIAAIGDYDGDGKSDIFWRNASTGQNYLYPMDGTTIKATEGFTRTVADLNWRATPEEAVDTYAGVDVGAPLIRGLTSVLAPGSAYDVTAAGSDIYATSDQFHFTHKAQSGDFDLRVRVASLSAVHEWSKAGLMARESLSADSRQVSVFATPAGGYEFQFRNPAGAFVQKLDSLARVSYPNTWVRLKRAGNVFTAYTSADGIASPDAMNWTQLGTTTMALPATVFLGLAVTSHDVAQSTLAKFRDLAMMAALTDTRAPSTPAGLSASAISSSQINLAWSASSDNRGVTGYRVLRAGVQIATTALLAYADTGLLPATAYTYTVVAFDAAGNVSAPSAAATAATAALPDITPPSIPTGLSAATVSSSQINLAWSASSDNRGVTGYRVLRGGALIGGTSALTFADTGLTPSTTYSYTVAALDAAGNVSAPSAAASATTAASGSNAPQLKSALGTNLEAVTYWSPQVPFVDVMKASSDWGTNDGNALDLDANGYVRSLAPGQTAHKVLLREFGGRYPAGVYLVRYKGEGTLTVSFDARVLSQTAGEMLVQVSPSDGGVLLRLNATNPANYLRDIEMLMPGGICEGDPFRHAAGAQDCGARRFVSFAEDRSLLFYPVFAERLRGYSVLRFMDWMSTNFTPLKSWSQRPLLSYHTWYTPSGVPLEAMIALANLVGAHPWFTIPHQADDDYARNFAQLLSQQLDPRLAVYVEHSNEIWNAAFPAYTYVNQQAAAQTPKIDGLQYHALRSRAIGAMFKATLGARVIAVLGAQAANPYTATWALDYLKSRFGSSALGIDAVAIAPYFGVVPGPATAGTYTSMTLDAFFAHVRAAVLPEALAWVQNYRAVPATYGVRLISYEGGQHMVGGGGAENDTALNALFDAFNRDPRMKQLYLDYLAGWRQAGGELFVHFNDVGRYTKWGRWGSLEYIAQPRSQAPKFDALQSFIEQNPVWWQQ